MALQNIVAYFDARSEAEAAKQALVSQGISASAIKLLPEEGPTSGYTRSTTETSYDHRADAGGFWASLGDLFLPDEDRYSLAEGMSRGGVALSVTADEADYDHVDAILDQCGADDIGAREAEWKSADWSGYTKSEATTSTASTTVGGTATKTYDAAMADDDGVIQVVEEQLRVGKRTAEGGRVRIRSYVREVPVEAQVELHSQHVTIERRRVDRAVTAADQVLFQDRIIEARESREEVVVAKEARVIEEIGLRSQDETHTQTVSDTVRKTEVEVVDERTGETVEGSTTLDAQRR